MSCHVLQIVPKKVSFTQYCSLVKDTFFWDTLNICRSAHVCLSLCLSENVLILMMHQQNAWILMHQYEFFHELCHEMHNDIWHENFHDKCHENCHDKTATCHECFRVINPVMNLVYKSVMNSDMKSAMIFFLWPNWVKISDGFCRNIGPWKKWFLI